MKHIQFLSQHMGESPAADRRTMEGRTHILLGSRVIKHKRQLQQHIRCRTSSCDTINAETTRITVRGAQ